MRSRRAGGRAKTHDTAAEDLVGHDADRLSLYSRPTPSTRGQLGIRRAAARTKARRTLGSRLRQDGPEPDEAGRVDDVALALELREGRKDVLDVVVVSWRAALVCGHGGGEGKMTVMEGSSERWSASEGRLAESCRGRVGARLGNVWATTRPNCGRSGLDVRTARTTPSTLSRRRPRSYKRGRTPDRLTLLPLRRGLRARRAPLHCEGPVRPAERSACVFIAVRPALLLAVCQR